MELKLTLFLLPCLLLLPVEGTVSSVNGTSVELIRVPSNNRRAVRLYSGTRPKPIVCEGEGFQADPTDCTIFHRCMKNGNGRYVSFRFQCGPGTIYDPDKEICNHPESTKRTECGASLHIPSVEFTIDNEISRELPTPLSTKRPEDTEKSTDTRHEFSTQVKNPWISPSHLYPNPSASTSNPFINKQTRIKSPKVSSLKREITSSSYPTTPVSVSPQKRFSTTATIDFQNSPFSLQSGDICKSNGFMGNSENCRKFYRCISNQRGGFIRYEFLCSDPTIWDDDKQVCNHEWAVKRKRCGRERFSDYSNDNQKHEFSQYTSASLPTESQQNDKDYGSKVTRTNNKSVIQNQTSKPSLPTQSQVQINHGLQVPQTHSQIKKEPFIQNETQINNGNNVKNGKLSITQNMTQISHGDGVSKTLTHINYGDKMMQTQLDHSKESDLAQKLIQVSQFPNNINTLQFSEHRDVATTSSINRCTKDGFMGDSTDCKKFYRCVDNGRGFTRYEFSCAEGTVWDSKIDACNHKWAVKECGGNGFSETTAQSSTIATQSTTKVYNSPSTLSTTTPPYTKTTTTTQTYYSSTEPESEDNNDIPYGNQPSPSATTNSPIQQTSTENKEPQSQSDNKCKSSGFMGDNKDCKKFYRCVDNGNGGYTRYEFTCGEGTVWDQRIEACNHVWAVEHCGGNTDVDSHKETTTKNVIQTTSTPTTSQTPPQSVDYDTGYGQLPQHDEQSSTIRTSTVKSTTTTLQPLSSSESTNVGNTCTSSGFMGDNYDCKKFYRCVDTGNGGFTRYEFSCGEGTVWDSKIQACNHAWAVEKCGGNSFEDIHKEETTTRKETEISPSSTTQAHEPSDTDDAGYGQQSQEPQSTSSTTSHPENQNPGANECETSGFMGDKNDCKVFYRCVDNGNGKFTRYEFSCGEGTVWDSKINACNHAWAVESCGSASTSTTSDAIVPVNNEDNSGYPMQNDEYPNQTTISSDITTKTTTAATSTDNICKSSGFLGDTHDCKKFYRCAEDGRKGFTRYEFTCGEGTVWDQSIEACNHAWAVSGRCSGSGNYNDSSDVKPTNQPHTTSSVTESEDQGYNQPTTQKTSTGLPSSNQCTQEGFYGDENRCKVFYRCVDDGRGGFIKYEFTCGEGTAWNQEIQACDHESSNNQCKTHASSSTTKNPSNDHDEMVTESTTKTSGSSTTNKEDTPTSQKPQASENVCQHEGFYGDPNDCKKFYRCVDFGGDGVTFTKYDFTCGDGTIWDQKILGCNFENSENKCTGSSVIFTTTTATSETVSSSSATTQESPTTKRPGGTSIVTGGDRCTMEGFFANTNDCKKFYRCVDNGKGGFTKYDFTCADGTVWVQEIQACDYDNGISNCSSKPQTIEEHQSSTPSQATTETQPLDKEDDEYPSESSSKQPETDEKCTSEGFYGNKKDCTKFYRCVDNGQGGYTKYDFTCGEGTAWNSNIQTCNHISEVETCQNNEQSQSKPSQGEESSQSTETTSTTKYTTSSESSTKPSSTSDDKCDQEGFFGNTKDCTKFYRCVDNGNGGYTKYDFTCAEGTIWDQDLTTCNHPHDVTNPSCKNGDDSQSSTENSSLSESSSSSSTSQSSQGSTESCNDGSSNCSEQSSSNKPNSQKVNCEKAGFFANLDDCKKFYRCVDWDGDGTRFSVFHFDCGEGTIWDPQLETCNHENSVYPPRNCSGTQSQTENVSQETTSSSTSTTVKPATSEQSPTTESTPPSTTEVSTTQQSSSSEQTTQATATEKTTTQEPSTSEQTTTENTTTTTQQSTSSEKTTTQQSTTSEKSTTQPTTTDQTTTEQTTVSEQTTTEQMTTNELTTQQSTTSEKTTQSSTSELTTQQMTTSEQTTQSSSSEQTTQQMTTSEQTTQSSSSELTTTQQSSTTEVSTTDSTTTEQQSATTEQCSTTTEQSSEQNTTEQQTTMEQENTTTEGPTMTTSSSESTTTGESTTSQETSSSEKDCPETEDDQYLYVCPTSFRRHPKYCDMFYQCKAEDDSRDVKVTMFKCPNNTIYDESQTQCVEEDKADQKCDGEKAQRNRVKRLNSDFKEPIQANRNKHSCSAVGSYPFDTDNECAGIFFKCQKTKSGKLRGYVHRCPEGYTYWSISKRCEKKDNMIGCKQSDRSWRDRWEIPLEKNNLAK